LIQPRGGKTVDIVVEREGELLVMSVTPELVERGDETVGRIGAGPVPAEYPAEMLREFTYPGFAAVIKAAQQVQYYSVFTLESFGKLLTGSISVKNLSGPISIAKVASDSAKYGLSSYLTILAILSISLGVLNLMPIPVLDGGHIVFHSIEWIKGSPVSEAIQEWSLRIGVSMVLCLMVFALYNDISRL
jgi:regulator of sigma E protease